MALSGLDIFKKLPKTNCGECGVPTCLAFAMKLAAAQAELSSCPHVDESALAELSEASAPPVRAVTIGAGDKSFKVGESDTLFRHEKAFSHPCQFGVQVDSGDSDDAIRDAVAKADAMMFERVQQELRMGFVAVRSTADAARFAEVVRSVASQTGLPLVLMTDDVAAMTAALEVAAASKPLIHAANEDNVDGMVALAVQHGCPLAVRSTAGLAALADLSEKASAAGVKEIVLDPASATAADSLRDLVFLRRTALTKKTRALGYPVISFPASFSNGDARLEALYAGMHVAKYADMIVVSDADASSMMPLMVLKQNLYTDPQRPMQMDQGIYEFGNPGADAPLLVTTNFSLTYFIVSSEIESSRVPTRLAIIDAEGLSVLTAWASGKFGPDQISAYIKSSGVADQVEHRDLIIPGLVAQISGELQQNLGDWKVVVGPNEASELPQFLAKCASNAA